jgi:hypothetical protein
MRPFLTLYTASYKRPHGLQRCMESVAHQTLVNEIEHLIVPDYVGVGIGGMYQRVSAIRDAVHGDYVHFLADDDVLASPTVVEEVKRAAEQNGYPSMLLVRVVKGQMSLPQGQPWPPVCGAIDLGCMVTRSDVWKAHAHRYGNRYEGDFDFAHAVAQSGHSAVFVDLLFLVGGVSHGEPEPVQVGPCKWVNGWAAQRVTA